MSKVLRGVGKIAGAVAAVTAVIPGLQPIAMAAAAVSAVASVGAQLTAKPPRAQGAVNDIQIGANMPMPYLMGRTFSAGQLIHDVGYGATLSGVVNPYRWLVTVHSCCGPVDALEQIYADFTAVNFSGTAASGYYANFLWRDYQLGARPEADALAPQWAGAPRWSGDYKLSGMAALGFSALFDKKGKKFTSGFPPMGAVWRGVKVYDPRLDSTYPGGSGAQRIADESTWAYSANPALHALAYAHGRQVNGVFAFGCDFGAASIHLPSFVAWANVCDANGWTVGGTIYEPGDRWNNLKLICEAGGAEPYWNGGVLHVRYQAPRVAVDTFTADDLAPGAVRIRAMKPSTERINGGTARYRSEAHKWEYVPTDLVEVSAYVTEDGEERQEERQFDLVQDGDQAAQLMAYRIVNGREAGPIALPGKPRWMTVQPGSAINVHLPEEGLNNQLCIITQSVPDPATGAVQMVLETETSAKHDFALGRTTTAPPTPSITSPEARDGVAANVLTPAGYEETLISGSGTTGMVVTASDAGGTGTITITAHDRIYGDKTVAVDAGTITGLALSTGPADEDSKDYGIYYDDAARAGGAVTYAATLIPVDAVNSPDNPARHHVSFVRMPEAGAGSTGGTSNPPGGGPQIGGGGGDILY